VKFQKGDSVIVTERSREYSRNRIGMTGTVENIYLRTLTNSYIYGVRFENLSNQRSAKGLFWFEARSLSHQSNNILTIESEEIPMFENYVVAKVQFLDNPVPVYSYALYDSNIFAGDTVVVQTGSHGFALAKIYEITDNPEAKKQVTKGRQVVCKVDFTAYNARQDALRRANELKRSMDAMLREAQTMAIYEMFAEKNPSLKAMLEEFKTLQSEIKGETNVGEQQHEAV
jgi:sulfate adenylyltransferase subunit 1 (EFTu-like GTPase family)